MKICMISGHGCIRMQKMAITLMNLGHEVHLIAHKKAAWHTEYASFMLAVNSEQMHQAIKLYAPHVDLFHVHNEPSWYVNIVKENTDKPVILDVHDSWAARYTDEEEEKLNEKGIKACRISAEERLNFQLADALVFPGEAFAKIVTDEFKLDQPSLVLPSYVPRRFYRYSMPEWIGGVTYEGRIDLPAEIDGVDNMQGFRYTDYTDLAKKANDAQVGLHLYSTREDEPYLKAYKDIAIVHPRQPYDQLMKMLSRHDWGLVGNTIETNEWKIAFPNKLFEYIAAGLPVVAINADVAGEFVEREGIGIVVKDIDELKERWGEHRKIRENIVKKRIGYSMEAHIGKLEALYERMCH